MNDARDTSATGEVRLVAVDMDGTFLDPSGEYDRERFSTLQRTLRMQGTSFVVASGNQYWALRRHFPHDRDVLYIAENGALVGTSDRILRTSPFDAAVADRAILLLDRLPGVFSLACGASTAYALRSTAPGRLVDLRAYYARVQVVDRWDQIDEPLLKFALGCPADATTAVQARLADALPEDCVQTSSGHGSIDIMPAGINKGTSLAWLGSHLGIDPADMVSFGDGGNDIEMLTYAGTGVAMADAPPHVKAAADQVTGSNRDGGVLDWLEQ